MRLGWTLETRRAYLGWLARARSTFVGAAALPTTLNHLRAAVEGSLVRHRAHATSRPSSRRSRPLPRIRSACSLARTFQKAWTPRGSRRTRSPPAPARGRQLFAEATCSACHRAGSLIPAAATGPDLTGVGQRFDHRALVESMIDPWKVVAPQYRVVSVTLKNGAIHEGPVVAEDEGSLTFPPTRSILAPAPVSSASTSPVSPNDPAWRQDCSIRSPATKSSISPPGSKPAPRDTAPPAPRTHPLGSSQGDTIRDRPLLGASVVRRRGHRMDTK